MLEVCVVGDCFTEHFGVKTCVLRISTGKFIATHIPPLWPHATTRALRINDPKTKQIKKHRPRKRSGALFWEGTGNIVMPHVLRLQNTNISRGRLGKQTIPGLGYCNYLWMTS
jgi:hypothetical protein